MADNVQMTSAATPPVRFMMWGIERPAGGVRVFASRHATEGVRFGQASVNDVQHWRVEGHLINLLIIDGADWNDALAQLFARWASEDEQDAVAGRKPPLAVKQRKQAVIDGGHSST